MFLPSNITWKERHRQAQGCTFIFHYIQLKNNAFPDFAQRPKPNVLLQQKTAPLQQVEQIQSLLSHTDSLWNIRQVTDGAELTWRRIRITVVFALLQNKACTVKRHVTICIWDPLHLKIWTLIRGAPASPVLSEEKLYFFINGRFHTYTSNLPMKNTRCCSNH